MANSHDYSLMVGHVLDQGLISTEELAKQIGCAEADIYELLTGVVPSTAVSITETIVDVCERLLDERDAKQ